MTVAAADRRIARPRQRGLKSLAGVLGFVALVLFLLAIEQRQAVAVWAALRDEAAPAAGRLFEQLQAAARGDGRAPPAAQPEPPAEAAAPGDRPLAGEFVPADAATRDSTGGVAFVAARIRFESGETLHTRPLRIAAGGDTYAPGLTFAGRWNAPADAQIELRSVAPPAGEAAAAGARLCGGAAPARVALLHRRDRVDLMLFAASAESPLGRPCGAWSYEQR